MVVSMLLAWQFNFLILEFFGGNFFQGVILKERWVSDGLCVFSSVLSKLNIWITTSELFHLEKFTLAILMFFKLILYNFNYSWKKVSYKITYPRAWKRSTILNIFLRNAKKSYILFLYWEIHMTPAPQRVFGYEKHYFDGILDSKP